MRLLTSEDPPAVQPAPDLVLENGHVRLVPLQIGHAAAIQPWVDQREEGLARQLGSPVDFDHSAERFIGWLLTIEDIVPFAVELAGSGEVVGYTRYLHVEPKRRMLHVGGTWYAPPVRGTAVNPSCKLLLLGHAFEVAGYNRVQIQTDTDNLRSQRAIARIGATFEGVSRADYLRRDGTVRSTWVASVIRSEWPAVRERLRRLVSDAPTAVG